MKITHPRLEKRPVQRTVTLDQIEEGVPCVVHNQTEMMVRVRQGSIGYIVKFDGSSSNRFSDAEFYTVIQRLDGKPLPQPKLPATLGDDNVEEGRLYVCCAEVTGCFLRYVRNGGVYSIENGFRKLSFWPEEYRITGITDWVVVTEEVEIEV